MGLLVSAKNLELRFFEWEHFPRCVVFFGKPDAFFSMAPLWKGKFHMSDSVNQTAPLTDGEDKLGSKLKHQAAEAGAEAKAKLGEVAGQVTEQAKRFGEQQRAIGAEQIGNVVGAVHVAARELEHQMPQAASFIHSTADKLSGAALALRDRNVNQLMTDISDFAKREPALFFGGTVLAGFVITRLLKSSAEASAGNVGQMQRSGTTNGTGMNNGI